jgi:hydrogenase/urease accessory protein HupE
MQGEMGLHLVPHLSSGWLDRQPDDNYAAPDYLIATWRLSAAGPLRGQTISIEGLAGTITDAIVRVQFGDGSVQSAVLRGESPSVVLAGPNASETGRFRFVELGITHILSGPDHLLFVLGLILLVSERWKLVTTITGFTLGHTATLILAGLLRLQLSVPLITLLIALSIVFLGAEIARARNGTRGLTTEQPWAVAVLFGLLHGLGFATGLAGLGLGGGELVSALFQFNVGVEIAQLGWLLVVLSTIQLIRVIPVRWPRPALELPAYVVGIAGAAWTLQCAAVVFGF